MTTKIITNTDSYLPFLGSEGPDTQQLFPKLQTETGLPEIPGYEVLGELGRGGMGIVYKARDLKLKRLVAIKMLLDPEFASPEQRIRFKIEAEAVAQLKHPHIVQVYDLGEMPGSKSGIPHPYMVLEYVDGPTLFRHMRAQPLTEREAAVLMVTLARAMQHAHDHGLIHRDLKPANILLSPELLVPSPDSANKPIDSKHSGQNTDHSNRNPQDSTTRNLLTPKITDFGLVKALVFDGDGQRDLTRPELMVGTPQYMAPEQANPAPKALSCSVDIYSLGVIFYELLTGQLPYDDKDILKMMMEVQTKEPISPCSLKPRISVDLETICLKCLSKNPEERYSSAAALADDLTRFLHNEPILARPLSEWQRVAKWVQRHPTIATLAGLLFSVISVALIVIATLWVQADVDRQNAVNQFHNAELARDVARSAEGKAREAEKAALDSETLARRTLYFSRISQADLLLRQGQLLRAKLLLRDTAEDQTGGDLRGWEWYHLARKCSPMEQTLITASDYVHQVAFHPNGKLLFDVQGAVFFGDKKPEDYPGELHLHTRNEAGGRWKLARTHLFNQPLRDLHLAMNGSKVILSNMSQECECYETAELLTGEVPIKSIRIPSAYHWALAAEAGQLVMWSKKVSREIKLFDLTKGAIVRTLTMPADIDLVTVDNRAELMMMVLKDYSVGVWDLKDDSLCWRKQLPQGNVWVSISEDGRQAAYLHIPSGEMKWVEARTSKPLLQLNRSRSDSVLLASQGDRLALAGSGQDGSETLIWHRQSSGEIDELPIRLLGHEGAISSRHFSHDGNLFVSTGLDGTVRAWDTTPGSSRAGQCLHTFRGHNGTVLSASIAPNNELLASGGIDANVILWNINHDIVQDKYNLLAGISGEWISGYRFIEGTNRLVMLDQQNGRLLHLDMKTRQLVETFALPGMFTGFRVPRYDSDFSSDGKLAAVPDKSVQRVMLIDTLTGKEVWSPPAATFRIQHVRFSGNGKRLLLAGVLPAPGSNPPRAIQYRSAFQVWDIEQRKLVHEGDIPKASMSWAINDDGSRVAAPQMTPQRNIELNVYKVDEQAKLQFSVPFDFRLCLCLAFSPDGRYLGGVNFDPQKSKIMMRNAETGKELWKRDAVHESVDIVFTADSRRVLSTSYDSNVIMHDVESGQDVLTLKHHGSPRMNDYAISPKIIMSKDGRKLAVHSWDSGLSVWHAYGKDDSYSLTIPMKRSEEESP